MKITQTDIAHLSDTEVKLVVLAVLDTIEAGHRPGHTSGLTEFWRRFVVAMIRARRERVGMLAALELDAMNDDDPGALVGPDDDPVADALAALRRDCRDQG